MAQLRKSLTIRLRKRDTDLKQVLAKIEDQLEDGDLSTFIRNCLRRALIRKAPAQTSDNVKQPSDNKKAANL